MQQSLIRLRTRVCALFYGPDENPAGPGFIPGRKSVIPAKEAVAIVVSAAVHHAMVSLTTEGALKKGRTVPTCLERLVGSSLEKLKSSRWFTEGGGGDTGPSAFRIDFPHER